LLDLAGALDVQLVVAVHHDLGDAGVAEERLERAVAENVVGDLLLQSRALARAERGVLRRQLFRHELANARRQILGAVEVQERRPQPRDAGAMDLRLQLGVRVSSPGFERARVELQPLGEDGGVRRGREAVSAERAHRRPRRSDRRSDFGADAVSLVTPAKTDFAIADTARAKRPFGSEITAGVARLIASGTAGSSGSSNA